MFYEEILSVTDLKRRTLTNTFPTALSPQEREFLESRNIRYVEHKKGGFTVIFTEDDPKETKYAHLDFREKAGIPNAPSVVRFITPKAVRSKPRRRR